MSGQQIGTVIGGAIGAYFGGPAGAQLGMAIGGAIGGAVDPTHINGPKIGDGQQQTATDGAVIAWVQGTAMVAGTLCQVSKRRQIRHKDNGKGSGTVAVTYTAVQDFAILICESCELRDSTMSSVLMVLQDGKLVYDVRPGSTMLADSYKWKSNVDFIFGAEDQLPHPTLEAITGVGNTPAYRGSLVAVFKNFDVSQAGDRIPTFQFVVASDAGSVTPDNILTATTKSTSSVYDPSPGTLSDAVVGFVQDISVPNAGLIGVQLDSITPWAMYRFVVQPIFSSVIESVRALSQDEMLAALNVTGSVDTGWEATYPPPTFAPHPAFVAWFAARQTDLPAIKPLGSYALPKALMMPPGAVGIRVYGFAFFAGFDAHFIDLTFDAADTSGLAAPTAVSGGYVEDGTGIVYRPPWRLAYGQSINTVQSVLLSDVVSRVARRGGLSAADYEAADFAGTLVAGYPIARQSNAADCLLPLLQAYFGYASEYDAQLHFKFYGANASAVVDRTDLIEGNDSNKGAIVSNLRNQSTEFPRRIVAAYMDPAQNYTVVNVPAERQAMDVIAIGDQSFQIPVVMAANDAARAAQKALKVAYATLEGTLEYSTPFAGADVYLSLAAGEPLQFQGKRYVADELILGSGSIKLTTRYDRQGAYTSNVQAIAGNAPTPSASPYSGPSTLIPMNLPAQRPQDSVGVYLVAASVDGRSSWKGCTVQASYDGMQSWQNVLQITMQATLGAILADEPSSGTPLTVRLTSGSLESATAAQVSAGANVFAVASNTNGRSQLGQFSTATELGTAGQYELTGVTRSLGGLPSFPVAAVDRFALMDAAYFLPIDPSFMGRTLYFRAVGFGEIAEDATIESLVYAALVPSPGTDRITEDNVSRIAENGIDLRFTE